MQGKQCAVVVLWLSCLLGIHTGIHAGQGVAKVPARVERFAVAADSLLGQKNDPWFSKDKFDHAVLSSFFTAGQIFTYRQTFDWPTGDAVRYAVIGTGLLGIGKEVYDCVSGRGKASLKDMVADMAGIGLAILIFRIE